MPRKETEKAGTLEAINRVFYFGFYGRPAAQRAKPGLLSPKSVVHQVAGTQVQGN
jgi:hypothetical protein